MAKSEKVKSDIERVLRFFKLIKVWSNSSLPIKKYELRKGHHRMGGG